MPTIDCRLLNLILGGPAKWGHTLEKEATDGGGGNVVKFCILYCATSNPPTTTCYLWAAQVLSSFVLLCCCTAVLLWGAVLCHNLKSTYYELLMVCAGIDQPQERSQGADKWRHTLAKEAKDRGYVVKCYILYCCAVPQPHFGLHMVFAGIDQPQERSQGADKWRRRLQKALH